MLIDAFSRTRLYNVGVAKQCTVYGAILLQYLMELQRSKDVVVINYQKIEEDLGFDKTDAQEALTPLKDMKLLNMTDATHCTCNMDNIIRLFSNDINVDSLEAIKRKEKKPTRTKAEVLFDNLCNHIRTDNKELYETYKGWIETITQAKGYLSVPQLEKFQTEVDTFANGNVDTAIAVVNVGIEKGYNVAEYCINYYMRNHVVSPVARRSVPQPMGTPSERPSGYNDVCTKVNLLEGF